MCAVREDATRGDCSDSLANDAEGDATAARGELVRLMAVLAGLEGITVEAIDGFGTGKEGLGVGIGVSIGSDGGRGRGVGAIGSTEV